MDRSPEKLYRAPRIAKEAGRADQQIDRGGFGLASQLGGKHKGIFPLRRVYVPESLG